MSMISRFRKEVQIVAFGDTEIGSAVSPAISSVHFYHKTMGQEVARMLVEILESGDDLKKHLKMGYQIVKKESLVKKNAKRQKTVANCSFFDLQKAKIQYNKRKRKARNLMQERYISSGGQRLHIAVWETIRERKKRSCRFRMA